MRPISNEVKEFLADVDAVVEATGAEQHLLWQVNSKEYPRFFFPQHLEAYEIDSRYDWEQINYGYLATVDINIQKPICISLMKAKVDGVMVLFWHPTNNYVNYDKIDKWLNTYIPRDKAIRTDATNFSHIRYAKERIKSEVADTLT